MKAPPDGFRDLARPPDYAAIADEVNREHPYRSLDYRLAVAMKIAKGNANPREMRAALDRPISTSAKNDGGAE